MEEREEGRKDYFLAVFCNLMAGWNENFITPVLLIQYRLKNHWWHKQASKQANKQKQACLNNIFIRLLIAQKLSMTLFHVLLELNFSVWLLNLFLHSGYIVRYQIHFLQTVLFVVYEQATYVHFSTSSVTVFLYCGIPSPLLIIPNSSKENAGNTSFVKSFPTTPALFEPFL